MNQERPSALWSINGVPLKSARGEFKGKDTIVSESDMRKTTFERRLSYECKSCGTVAERLRTDRKCEKCGRLLWEALVEDQREGKETGGVLACGK